MHAHHNGRPALPASSFPASQLNLRPNETRSIVCPECRTWRVLSGGVIRPHRTESGVNRCTGSGQRVYLDIPLAELEERQTIALADAATRRSARTHLKPAPPVATPLHLLAARNAA